MGSTPIASTIETLDRYVEGFSRPQVNENSEVIKVDGESVRGYKLGTLRGIMDDSGIIEEIVFDSIKPYEELVYQT